MINAAVYRANNEITSAIEEFKESLSKGQLSTLPLRELQMIERQQRLMFKILTRIDNYQLARDFDFWRGWARKDAQEARIRAEAVRRARAGA